MEPVKQQLAYSLLDHPACISYTLNLIELHLIEWLKQRGIEPPTLQPRKKGREGKKHFRKKGKIKYERK